LAGKHHQQLQEKNRNQDQSDGKGELPPKRRLKLADHRLHCRLKFSINGSVQIQRLSSIVRLHRAARCIAVLVPILTTVAADLVPARFTGSQSCASSGCHGGASEKLNQHLVWSVRDFHSQRPYATLTTARSRQIAAAAGIRDAATDSRCTTCHAPLMQIPAALRPANMNVREGVSCESCHGPAEPWLRAHARLAYPPAAGERAWTHADNVQLGLRDLSNLYVRANTCIACHQTVELELIRAGHPELVFELDGQAVSQPKHWREKQSFAGPKAWLVGQAAALREASWQLSREAQRGGDADARLVARWKALLWLIQKTDASEGSWPSLKGVPDDPIPQNTARAQRLADDLARAVANTAWSPAHTRKCLTQLAGTAADFRDKSVPPDIQARRAERLALALDRLVTSLDKNANERSPLNRHVDELFRLVQSLPDFQTAAFAVALDHLARDAAPKVAGN
jgi:hypothetical protein